MSDPVNSPSHYNQNGIEVIDVIETYTREDFRLSNVLKYVCRCEYKGKKLEDLKKAAWYLNRVITELEDAAWDGISFPPAEPYEWPSPQSKEEFLESLREAADLVLDGSGEECPICPTGKLGETHCSGCGVEKGDDEVDALRYAVMGEGLPDDHPYHDTAPNPDTVAALDKACDDMFFQDDYTYHFTPPEDRIAGDDLFCTRIKDQYYGYDRDEVLGNCAYCEKDLVAKGGYLTSPGFEDGVKFCSFDCIDGLRKWQGR